MTNRFNEPPSTTVPVHNCDRYYVANTPTALQDGTDVVLMTDYRSHDRQSPNFPCCATARPFNHSNAAGTHPTLRDRVLFQRPHHQRPVAPAGSSWTRKYGKLRHARSQIVIDFEQSRASNGAVFFPAHHQPNAADTVPTSSTHHLYSSRHPTLHMPPPCKPEPTVTTPVSVYHTCKSRTPLQLRANAN